jgi:hypothetical protein
MRAPGLVFAAWIGLMSACLSSCAYPRYTTPLHAELNPKLSSKDRPGGVYTFRLISAELPPTKISGLTWDDDGSGPDPFVRLYVDGRLVWESEVKSDQARPEWNVVLPRNVAIRSNSLFRLELWDRDTSIGADPIGQLERRGLPANVVLDAQARLQLGNATVLVMVQAPHAHKGVGLAVEARSDKLEVLSVEPYSPAGRAGIRVGDIIVGVGSARVSQLGPEGAVSALSLASERGHKVTLAGKGGERQVTLDQGYVWLVM